MEDKPKILDRFIDFIFSKDERRWLILIFLLGVILRFIVARNISLLADEGVHGAHIIGFLHSGLISTFAQSPLWFYLSDIFLRILGVTVFSLRFSSFLFGSLSIILVYAISMKVLRNRKLALLASLFLAASTYTIRYTMMEMDLSALFFIISAVYLYIKSIEKGKFPYLSAVCMGLAALTKTLAIFFVPAFLLGFFIFNKSTTNSWADKFKINFKRIILFSLIIILIFSPVLIHNYLWYKDKGLVDVYLAQYGFVEKAREAYSGLQAYDQGFEFSWFMKNVATCSKVAFFEDPIIIFFGVLGIFYVLFSKHRKYPLFMYLISFQLLGLLILYISTGLPTHYTTTIPVFCIFASFFIGECLRKFNLLDKKKFFIIIVIVFLLFQLIMLLPNLTSRCSTCKLSEYTSKMDKESIVVVDSRIYRGRIALLFYNFHYLESTLFSNLMELNNNLSGKNIPTKVYFIECAVDDCGWGTIKDQPQFNISMETLFNHVSSQVYPEKTIYGGGGYGIEEIPNIPAIKVYQTTMNLNPQLISAVDSTHDWFFYPVNYSPKEKIFDNYEVNGFFDSTIYFFAWVIIIFSIIFSILFTPIIIINAFLDSKL